MKMPGRSQILQSVDRFEKRDPELYRELRRKAAEPTDDAAVFPIARKAAEILEEFEPRPEPDEDARPRRAGPRAAPTATEAVEAVAPQPSPVDTEVTAYERRVAETIVRPSARPVLAIRNNRVTTEFLGPDSETWAARIDGARTILDAVIPAIGRVEVKNNADFSWVGTAWLVADDIIVTNRHVAREFGRSTTAGFIFRVGVNGGPQSALVDFLEEFDRSASLEFAIESILWIATPTEPDVAYLRVKRSTARRGPATPIPLAEAVSLDNFVVTIGYPARDPRVPDQRLVQRIFGDVYEKKRLAPGQVTDVGPDELQHDCSTLGGNSGSPVINLKTGEAVGLHFSGLFLESNFAVPAPKVRELLGKVQRAELPGMGPIEVRRPVSPPSDAATPVAASAGIAGGGTYSFQFQIPVEITIKVGGVIVASGGAPIAVAPGAGTGRPADSGSIEAAVNAARQALAGRSDLIEVRPGYRFKRGWITDERVVVVEVRKKLTPTELRETGTAPMPTQVLGIGVDVRTAALPDQLEHLGIDLAALEAPPKPGGYREPPDLSLDPVEEPMRAIFHISPDSGFPNLRDFLGRVRRRLTATMYEWEADHISDAIEQAIKPAGRKLKMVTERAGTREAVEDMKNRLGSASKFGHVWASVGAGKLITSDYHIKVASRDGEEFWLSSGNWKDSNQPNIDPAGENSTLIGPLRQKNREWHVIIANEKLATMFQKYVEWDFKEAERVPIEERPEAALPELFVPDEAFAEGLERRIPVQYVDPLVVDRVLHVRPLLTPDRDARGRRMFLDNATKLVERATRKIFIQNQSFSLLEENIDEFEQIFGAIKDKQQAGLDVRIIFRDAREFSQANGPKQQKLLERLKDFGFDTDLIRVQMRCHTKAIIVDPPDSEHPDSGEVLFGSHNLTNTGALFNRDASLLISDAEVTAYFEKAFLFDWEVLATQEADELVGGVRVARPGEETPPGYRRVSLNEYLGES
jgi:S1-C subfamily serine protease